MNCSPIWSDFLAVPFLRSVHCSRVVDFWILQRAPRGSWTLRTPPVWPLALHLKAEVPLVGMRAGSWAENLENTHIPSRPLGLLPGLRKD